MHKIIEQAKEELDVVVAKFDDYQASVIKNKEEYYKELAENKESEAK